MQTKQSITLRFSTLLLAALPLLLGSCDSIWPKYNACHLDQCGDATAGADLDTSAADSKPDGDGLLADQASDADGSGGDQSLAPPAWAVAAGSACGSADAGATGCVDQGQAIALDSVAGNVLVAGTFQGTVAFGATTLTATGSTSDIFVAKLDPAGKFLWAAAATSKASNSASGVAVDSSGNAYISGTISGSTTMGTTSLTVKKTADMFVARVDGGTGKFTWATVAEADNADGMGIGGTTAAGNTIGANNGTAGGCCTPGTRPSGGCATTGTP